MYYGDFAEDATVRFMLTTQDKNGAAVAPSSAFEAADLKIYKDDSDAEKTTANGVTMTSPKDGVTGRHHVAIDTSNDTGDAGFWVTGADYFVVLDPDETVDSEAAKAVVAHFSIENRYMRGTNGANTTTPPTAVQIRQEMDSNSADLNTALTDLTQILSDIAGLNDPTAAAIATEILTQANGIEGGVTLQGATRLILSAVSGILAGADTATVTTRDVADSKNRLTVTTDADGNRSAVTRDMT